MGLYILSFLDSEQLSYIILYCVSEPLYNDEGVALPYLPDFLVKALVSDVP